MSEELYTDYNPNEQPIINVFFMLLRLDMVTVRLGVIETTVKLDLLPRVGLASIL